MHSIHQQIDKYIKGRLTEEEIDHLWMNVLSEQVWYDYFVTELTAHSIYLSTKKEDDSQFNRHLWNLVENNPEPKMAD